jgi:hypothetical protein
MQQNRVKKQEVIDKLSDTISEKKAGEVINEASDKIDVHGQEYDADVAISILEAVKELDDVDTLTSIAANTAITQLRSV